jgi:acyl-CoA dehydrogenase
VVHDFAKNVIRPVAHEWDEREETPWPVIEEAARVGIYPDSSRTPSPTRPAS